jgi:hypothetical protein
MNQVEFFNHQFQSSISQINLLKNSIVELNGKMIHNSSLSKESKNPTSSKKISETIEN